MVELAAAPFSWNPLTDVHDLLGHAFMRNALIAGTVAALVSALVGYFVVLRGLVFAADALTHVGFAGASGAVLVGLSPAFGLIALTSVTAVAIGTLEQRLRSRDVVVGLVLVEALGLGVLFLHLAAGYSNETYALLFGDILALSSRDLAMMLIAGLGAVVSLVAVFRPLLFTSLDEEVAQARGVPVRGLGVAFLLILAIAVAAATQVVGALLAVALIVAPAASAQCLTHRPARALIIAVAIALGITWVGIALAWWIPFPVSFFITTLGGFAYTAARTTASVGGSRRALGIALRAAAAGVVE